ncbi:MAG: methyltransferase [Magnetovibrio sp.]|nr:methyltransferase [Magnetovibrio sp.]
MSAAWAANVTASELLGGRVQCLQPARGYRTAIDPVFLAAAVPARPGDRALDVGTGSGAAAFCLAARVPGVRVSGLELQPALADLARTGAAANAFAVPVEIVAGDILDPPPGCPPGGFDHVMANPPYMRAGEGNPPAEPAARVATIEGRARLADWLDFCFQRACAGGTVTVVHRAERAAEIGALMAAAGAGYRVLPLLPKSGRAAKRVLVQARKGVAGDAVTLPGLVLHAADGAYTAAADAVLRDADDLLLSMP